MVTPQYPFERALGYFQETAQRVFDSGSFEGPDFEHRVEIAGRAFDPLAPMGYEFLDIVKGRVETGRAFGQPETGRSICFPERFLRARSVDQLASPLAEQTSEMLDRIFFEGLLFHLLVASFSTRSRIPELDISALREAWYVDALLASRFMRDYDKDAGGEASFLFKSLIDEEIDPYLKDVARFGIWKRAKAHSNLENLYFAGALLGMMADAATLDL